MDSGNKLINKIMTYIEMSPAEIQLTILGIALVCFFFGAFAVVCIDKFKN